MNDSRVVAIVLSGQGTRDLTRTLDTIARQAPESPQITITCAANWTHLAFATSSAERMRGRVEAHAGHPADSVNRVVHESGQPVVCLVPAGYRLADGCIAQCLTVLDASPSLAAAAPRITIETADGTCRIDRRIVAGFVDLVSEPASAPPILLVRRDAFLARGGLTDGLCVLPLYELALRLAKGDGVAIVGHAHAFCDAAGSSWRAAPESARLDEYRRVLAQHREAVERHMVAIIAGREIAFARLRDEHRRALERRDTGLVRLDEERAAAAHHRAWLAHHGRAAFDWGDLRRTDPVSRDWGYDRGAPVDRHYIESFLAAHSSDVRGSVLEVQEADFTARFGGPRVERSTVLDIDNGNARATLIADLRHASHVPADSFDAIILTQTLHVIDDMPAALGECHRILKPGGVLLATVPSASRVCLEYGDSGDLWRMTAAGARALAEPAFGSGSVECTSHGNVLTNVAFLEGLGAAELTDGEYALADPYFPALIGVRAVKRAARRTHRRAHRGIVLLYHRIAEEPHALNVSPHTFRAQVAWLSAHCNVVPLDVLLSSRDDDLPERAVSLTFDDGYLDNLACAAPMLAEAGIPATFFLTTRWLEEPGEYWWDLLDRTLRDDVALPRTWRVEDGVPFDLPLGTPEQRKDSRARLHDRLVHASLADRNRLVAQLHGLGDATGTRYRPMTADEVLALGGLPGLSIGAHTVNHLSLADQDEATVRHEIEESRRALERILGRRVHMLAYPYGDVNACCAGIVRASVGWGLTCEPNAVKPSFDAAMAPRVQVGDWGVEELRARMETLLDPPPGWRSATG